MSDPLTVIDAMLEQCERDRADLTPVGGRGVPFDGGELGLIIRRSILREVHDAITGDDPSHWPADELKPGQVRLSSLFPEVATRG